VYDAAEDRMVVVSGASGASCRVRAFDLADMAWKAVSDAAISAPSWRDRPVLAYDPDRRRLMLYGGDAAAWQTEQVERSRAAGPDTVWLYSLNGRAWSPVAATGGDARTGAVGVFDAAANRLVVFGGSTGDSARNDVRALELPDDLGLACDGQEKDIAERRSQGLTVSPEHRWQTLHDGQGTAPAPRVGAVGVYDAASGRLLVHGGRRGEITQPGRVGELLPPREVALADLWAFDLASGEWTVLSDGTDGGPGTRPGARWHHAGLIDADRSQVVICGGRDVTQALADTWAYDLETSIGNVEGGSGWSLLNDGLDPDSPGSRSQAVAALREPGGQLVLCGGESAPTLADGGGDVWSMALGPAGQGPESGEGVARDSLPVLGPSLSPNPARSEINVSFSLARPARVRVAFYDAAGRLVRVLRDADTQAGLHSLWWTGLDGNDRRISEGVYFCRIVAEGFTWTRPAVILW
ncbi:MAG: kelch repeat-containing protein, partial [bacterium]